MTLRSFASDNTSGVLPEVMEALKGANTGTARPYGADDITAKADALLRENFGAGIDPYFVFLGTAANVLCLKALTRPWETVLCADVAHINVDECGAPEANAGVKLTSVATADGKLTPQELRPLLGHVGVEHRVQPRVVSITQATELGVVYSPEEIRALSAFCKENDLYLHMDGARLANAAAALDLPLAALTRDCGVDALSFGGTKNGLMYGEAVIFFDPELSKDFKYLRKQGMQLASKMRFIAAQFAALLTDELWLKSASHANAMAARLEKAVFGLPGIELTQPVQTNALFPRLPAEALAALQKEFYFYAWDEERSVARWMTAFDTTEEEVDAFARAVAGVVA